MNTDSMKSEDHYFKIDKKILKTNDRSISKKGLLEYFLHCRRSNPKKNLGCSFGGAKDAKEYLGLDRYAYTKALKELEDKFLIALRPDVKTGYFKTVATEVLAFPKYDKKNRRFLENKTRVHNHRTYSKNDKFINIPSIIIDRGYFKRISIQSLFAILWLYSEANLVDCRGINYNFIHSLNSENKKGYRYHSFFGGGFSKEIYRRPCVEALVPNRYILPNVIFQGNFKQAVVELVDKNLFEWVPLLLKEDKEDPDISEVVGEVFRGIVPIGDNKSSNLYLFLEPPEDIRVIWILRPNFFVKSPEYTLFKQITDANYDYEYNRYNYTDVGTHKEIKKEYIKDEYFESYLYEWKHKYYDKVKYLLEESDGQYVEEILNILPDSVFRGFRKYKESF